MQKNWTDFDFFWLILKGLMELMWTNEWKIHIHQYFLDHLTCFISAFKIIKNISNYYTYTKQVHIHVLAPEMSASFSPSRVEKKKKYC